MSKITNIRGIRIERGHGRTLKGKCRFCGETRVLFKIQNRPDCEWRSIKAQTRETAQTNEQTRRLED